MQGGFLVLILIEVLIKVIGYVYVCNVIVDNTYREAWVVLTAIHSVWALIVKSSTRNVWASCLFESSLILNTTVDVVI